MSIDFNIISAALKVTKSAVEKRANRESWAFSTVTGRGGKRKLFELANLPRDVAKRVEIHQRGACASKELAIVAQVRAQAAAELQATRQKGELSLRKVAEIHAPAQQVRFDSRYTIVKSWESWYAAHPMGKKISYWAYADAFNANEINLDVALLQKYQPLQGRSVEHWVLKFNKEGMAGLIDGWTGKARKDVNVFTTQPELEKTAIAILIQRPTITMKTLTDLLGTAAIDRTTGEVLFNAPSYFATTRFCNAWKTKNEEFFMASTNPDEWKNKRMVAFGDASEGVERLNQRWEMDSTPADWMLKTEDGGLRRYSVSVIIDVYSRRAIMVLSPTPRAETHKLALRLALLSWGVPEVIVTDNGKDYIGRDFVGTLQTLNIEQVRTNPFSPWEKPFVERMNQTMLHSVMEAYTAFIGHNVAERSAIEARTSFAERLFSKDKTPIEMAMPAALLQERLNLWLKGTYEQDKHEGLGMSPFAKAAAWTGDTYRIEDERALDVLLAPPAGKGTYVVGKKGINYDNAHFIAMELGLMAGKSVQVRLTDDLGQIVVYHEGKFVCIARCPERTGINRQELAAKARQVQRNNITDQRKAAKAKKVNTDSLVDLFLRDKAEAAGKLATLPKASVTHTSTGLTASGEAARVLDGVVAKTEVPAELKRLIDKRKSEEIAPVKQAAVSNVSVIPESDEHRFKKWLDLDELLKNGGTIDNARLTRWYGSYQQTPEFAIRKRRLDEGKEQRNTAATVLRLNGTTNKQG
ncbi:transposase family protein [Undibacterium sp.]|uniref:transposase family protein n=1 Tax=Undibacterium sp. TaxID=1914977 RepID=UPI0027310E0E|nr:transposase family protein [Undibacterium sp.]MDP1980507.1 transposase family protein [Undibacterium sp.]